MRVAMSPAGHQHISAAQRTRWARQWAAGAVVAVVTPPDPVLELSDELTDDRVDGWCRTCGIEHDAELHLTVLGLRR
jgi:hypothetical protein